VGHTLDFLGKEEASTQGARALRGIWDAANAGNSLSVVDVARAIWSVDTVLLNLEKTTVEVEI
jgi:hypothetical protein